MNKPLCELTHIEALAALEAAESRLSALKANGAAERRARLMRPENAESLPLPPLYHVVMSEIHRLMDIPEDSLSPSDEILLDALVDVAMVYEQSCLPGWLFPQIPPHPEGETP